MGERHSYQVAEYLLYIDGEPQFLMLARIRARYLHAMEILTKHQGRSVTRGQVMLRSKKQVSKTIWAQFEQRCKAPPRQPPTCLRCGFVGCGCDGRIYGEELPHAPA